MRAFSAAASFMTPICIHRHLRADRDGLVDNRRDVFAFAETVDDVDFSGIRARSGTLLARISCRLWRLTGMMR